VSETPADAPTDWRDSPLAWFAELDRALAKGDLDRVDLARSELRRLGIHVRFEKLTVGRRWGGAPSGWRP
jgi:hypothetical protein